MLFDEYKSQLPDVDLNISLSFLMLIQRRLVSGWSHLMMLSLLWGRLVPVIF